MTFDHNQSDRDWVPRAHYIGGHEVWDIPKSFAAFFTSMLRERMTSDRFQNDEFPITNADEQEKKFKKRFTNVRGPFRKINHVELLRKVLKRDGIPSLIAEMTLWDSMYNLKELYNAKPPNMNDGPACAEYLHDYYRKIEARALKKCKNSRKVLKEYKIAALTTTETNLPDYLQLCAKIRNQLDGIVDEDDVHDHSVVEQDMSREGDYVSQRHEQYAQDLLAESQQEWEVEDTPAGQDEQEHERHEEESVGMEQESPDLFSAPAVPAVRDSEYIEEYHTEEMEQEEDDSEAMVTP